MDRMDGAEEQIAHLTRAVEDLSEVVARQSKDIERLSRRVGLLLEREAEREADSGGGIPLADQRPPHW
ncbi:SlyX family protein [Cereibacter changlensis]|jgi:SlyX protein|uniref:SlyX family protein n=1 Tax=Cereibacter changlensis TaxID=402884 RepID=UPI0029D9B45D|nr:SlyX protein [Cereibacter sp.]